MAAASTLLVGYREAKTKRLGVNVAVKDQAAAHATHVNCLGSSSRICTL